MFYQPVQSADRYFSSRTVYLAIDWNRMSSIVPAFKQRITDWYIGPGRDLTRDWHNAFSVMAIDCLLIDTLAQFEQGVPESSGSMFIGFAKRKLPEFAVSLPAPIKRPTKRDMTTAADVLYAGFRCGIVHEAHIPPYASVNPEPGIVRCVASGHTKYADGTDCPAVFVDPVRLFRKLEGLFQQYISELLDPSPTYRGLQDNFRKKFTSNYGIDILNAT